MPHDRCDECGSTGPRCHPACSEVETPPDYPRCLSCGADDYGIGGTLNLRGDCPACAKARREAEYDG